MTAMSMMADQGKARAISAGTDPGPVVHPAVISVMKEIGLDISSVTPQRLTPELARTAQYLITMGCGDQCPVVPGAVRDDWPLDDPNGKSIDETREIRNQIHERVRQLIGREQFAP